MQFGCFCAARGCASKKTLLALERARSDIARRRQRLHLWQAKLDPRRLVFIDETWIKTNMGHCADRGERVRSFTPHGHWRTLTFLGTLRCDRLTALACSTAPSTANASKPTFSRFSCRSFGRRHRDHGHVWTPPLLQEVSFAKSAWRGRVLTCVRPLMRRSTCRGLVCEFAERVQFNLARSKPVSMIWFSRSRLVDRCAILSVRPSHIVPGETSPPH